MSKALQLIAEFDTPGEAQEAQALLQAEGIAAVVGDSTTSEEEAPIFGHRPSALVQVSVPVADADRARHVLQKTLELTLDRGWENLAEAAVDGWVCSGCDTVVPNSE